MNADHLKIKQLNNCELFKDDFNMQLLHWIHVAQSWEANSHLIDQECGFYIEIEYYLGVHRSAVTLTLRLPD